MLAGVGPPDPGSTAIRTRSHRSVSLLPMVRGALEGLLFVSSTSSSSGGGVGITAASNSSSHVLQGQGQVYPSPLHLWLTSWRRSSSSSPLSRLISNLLIILLHEQRRQPGSLATTLHVPHIGTHDGSCSTLILSSFNQPPLSDTGLDSNLATPTLPLPSPHQAPPPSTPDPLQAWSSLPLLPPHSLRHWLWDRMN